MLIRTIVAITVVVMISIISCSDIGTNAVELKTRKNSPTGMAFFKLKANQNTPFQLIADSAMITIFADDMEDIIEELTLTDSSVEGTVDKIPAGPDRTFNIEIFDSAGALQYLGSAIGDVIADSTVKIPIIIRRKTGNTIIEGTIDEAEEEPTDTISTAGLVAYYPFNGNANDESGNGNNGTIHSATLSKDRNGNENSAYSFDGIDDYIEIEDSETRKFESFSFSLWYRATEQSYNPLIIKRNEYETDEDFGLFLITGVPIHLRDNPNYEPGDKIVCRLYGVVDSQITTTNISGVHGTEWNHIAVTFTINENLLTLYFNGEPIASSKQINSGTWISNSTLKFGHDDSSDDQTYLAGEIDDIYIYNRAITKAEIDILSKQ